MTHGDADGICAGALALARYDDAEVWFTHPAGLLEDLRELGASIVVICDVAISENEKDEIFSEFDRIKGSGGLIYIDHHPLPLNTVSGDIPCTRLARDNTKSASELTFRLFENDIDKELERIALLGAISDYCDATEFVHSGLEVYDKRTIYLEAGLLSQCLGASRKDYNFKKKLITKLSKIIMPSAISKVVERAIKSTKKEWNVYQYVHKRLEIVDGVAVVKDIPEGTSSRKVAKFAIGAGNKDVGIGVKFRKDFADLTLREKEDFPLDLNRVLRTLAPRFGGTGGGHPNAAGARIPKEALDDFISAIAREVSAIL